MSITFENPPINEVVIGTYFNPPLNGLRSEHIGLFWEKIKKDFPVVQQQNPIMQPQHSVAVDAEVFPLPRYWFVGSDEVNLIQIQKNAFLYNWRRRNKEYPRFHESIKPAFDKWYGIYTDFIQNEVGEDEPRSDIYELTYINTVEKCDFWAEPRDTVKIIPSFSMPLLDSSAPGAIDIHCSCFPRINQDLQLAVTIRTGSRTQQPDIPVLVFEIKATGRLSQAVKSAIDEWFTRAHDAIEKCFLDLTSPDVRNNFWGQMENVS